MAKRYKKREEARAKRRSKITVDEIVSKKNRLKPRKEKPISEKKESEERFDKAFAISLGLIAILSLLIFIPLLGPLMGITIIPYIACNLGCRYVNKRNGIQVGILVGIIWAIVEFYLLFQILNFVKISVTNPAIRTNLDIFIVILIFFANILFCMIGGYTGGAKFERKNNRKISHEGTEAFTD